MKTEIYKLTEKKLYEYPFLLKRISMLNSRLSIYTYENSDKSYFYEATSNYYIRSGAQAVCEKTNAQNIRRAFEIELRQKKQLAKEVEKSLECLTEVENKVITMRYFELKRMLEISEALGYSREYTSKIRKSAVTKVGLILF